MASYITARQPFGVVNESRLQTLVSAKNSQNNMELSPMGVLKSLDSPASAPSKKRLASDLLADEEDSENVDPSLLLSPSKRTKTALDTPIKAPMFVVKTAPSTAPSKLRTSTPSLPSATALNLRGSPPKNKRISLLSNGRRIRTPFKRVDPLHKQSPLPFSIDAALSGTISTYATPEPIIAAREPETRLETCSAPALSKKSSKGMPNAWFFEIHEDTPDQEATNLMEHSAATLDISSDDDAATSRARELQERGKENVPPPDWTGPVRSTRSASRGVHKGIKCAKKAANFAMAAEKAESRPALASLDVAAFSDGDEPDQEAAGKDAAQ